MDRVAGSGLRYTHFHSTAVCSPTRAALISGRNHHQMGTAPMSGTVHRLPGYNSIMTKDKATIAKILKDNGYVTSWFGKNHNTPDVPVSKIGPFDQWPIGLGFDYFYGFMGGDTSQWQPGNLVRNTTYIYPTRVTRLQPVTAMADDAIDYMKRVDALNPEQPFFVYYAPGHPCAAPPDKGMDRKDQRHAPVRRRLEQAARNHLRKPEETRRDPAGRQADPVAKDLIKEWDQLSDLEKKLFIKQADVFAAYVAYTDHEIGRVIQAVEDMGRLDNTLIIYINGDNGTSSEGGPTGTPNEVASVQGVTCRWRHRCKYYDVWGSDQTYPHMSVGWTWAFGTPFSWTKMVCSHFGGTKQGMAISWPEGDQGQGRHPQPVPPCYRHCADHSRSDRDSAAVVVDGIKQKPMEGVSMAYTFDKKNAAAPSMHKTQYFEMIGDRAIYHDGWILSTKVMRVPWDNSGKGRQ
jgi:arylsulfatase A-like enzyme